MQQSFKDFELIVIDDGSTDHTEEYLLGLQQESIRYFKTDNRERSHARNFGLSKAVGKYINYFDSDDIMYPDRLQIIFDSISARNFPPVIYSHYDFVNDQGVVIGRTERFYTSITKDLLFNNFLAVDAVFLRKDVAQEYPFLEDRRIITAEDWELWLRVHTKYEFIESTQRTFAMVVHGGRSLHTISPSRVRERELFFIDHVSESPEFKAKYGKDAALFVADRYTFLALTLAINGNTLDALTYWMRSFTSSVGVLGRRRFWGVIKTLIWRPERKS